MTAIDTIIQALKYAQAAKSTIDKVKKAYELFCAIRADYITYENYREEYRDLENAHTMLSEELADESDHKRREVMNEAMKLIHYQLRRVSRVRRNKVPESTAKFAGTTAGGAGGAYVGAKAGAVLAAEIGCIAGPPGAAVGAFVGGVTGGVLGALGGKAIMDKIFD